MKIKKERLLNFKKIYLFDLDGVILNSKKNMNLAWNSVMEGLEIEIKFENYFNYIGLPFREILKKLKIDKSKFTKAEKIFILNSKKNLDKLKLYNKVSETINLLKKRKKIIGVLTSKDKIRTLMILKKFNLNFDFVLCPVSKKLSKPNPFQIFEIMKTYKSKKKDLVFVGDMDIDKLTAHNAGIDFIYCNYGYGKKILKKNFISRFSQILNI
tara:strand:- start:1617 stop:2252 length:636 start_codon:yes stop_codon:yes gene_type:complete